MLTTTLLRLRENKACKRGYDLIANHVGIDFTGVIPLETILDNNGLIDCIWSLRAADGGKEIAQEFAIRVAMKVYFEPSWVKWANGWINGEDRSLASADAAYDAAYAAVVAADDAAYDAAYAAVVAADAAAYAAVVAAADAAYDAAAYAARNKMKLENIEILRILIK